MFLKCFQLTRFTVKPNLFSANINNDILVSRRWAGHSKWQNIQHIKSQSDGERMVLFQKLAKKIAHAVTQGGGTDPNFNSKLRAAIEECKKNSMPNTSIQQAIKLCSARLSAKPFWVTYSGKNGLVIAVEVTYKNLTEANQKMNNFFKRIMLKPEKGIENFADEKGIIHCAPPTSEGEFYDKAVEDAIEIGVSEVEETDNRTLVFQCLPTMIEVVEKKLSDKGYKIFSASNELEFKSFVKLNPSDLETVNVILEKLKKQCTEILKISLNLQNEDC